MKNLKTSLIKFVILLFFSTPIFSALGNASEKKHSFVLVHGALLTSQSWQKVQDSLTEKGIDSSAVDVPGRKGDTTSLEEITLEFAAKKVCEFSTRFSAPQIWVGHSQGGAIITQALNFCPDRIAALVYVSAVAPLPHEGAFQELGPEEDKNFNQCATFDSEKKLYVFNPKGPIREMFMADLSIDESKSALQYFVSEPSEIGAGILNYPLNTFLSKPKFYIETTQDKIIFPITQKKYQAKASFKKVYTLDSSHSPFLSQPDKLASILEEIKGTLETHP